jgi:hypothetical protein
MPKNRIVDAAITITIPNIINSLHFDTICFLRTTGNAEKTKIIIATVSKTKIKGIGTNRPILVGC